MKVFGIILIIFTANFLSANDLSFKVLKEIINKSSYEDYAEYVKNHDITSIISHIDDEGLSLLILALSSKAANINIIKDLLAKGANPNQPCLCNIDRKEFKQNIFYKGWTAAHIAVSLNRSSDVLDVLLQYNADFFQVDDDNFSAAILAFRYVRLKSIKWMHNKNLDLKKLSNSENLIVKNKDQRTNRLFNNYFKRNKIAY